jgi:hypothetical protein
VWGPSATFASLSGSVARMEGGFERGSERPAPQFEPPVEPGGAWLRGLALVARIMRGRELAADAAGIPPLDSDQVLDLQRTAGNRLTTGALGRWTDLLAQEPVEGPVAQQLLAQLLPARAADPGLHAAICAALDAAEPSIQVRVSGPPGPAAIELRGPAGAAASAVVQLDPGAAATVALSFTAAFGPAAGIGPGDALAVSVGGATLELPVPFAEPVAAAGYVALAELV